MSNAAYDGIAENYQDQVDPDRGGSLRDPVFEQLVGDIQDQQVLALACGQGRDARLLADLGAHVVGFDISEQMLAYARELEAAEPRGIQYVQGDAAKGLDRFDDQSFDGVACHMALIDMPELEPTIASVARILRPGGWFVFSIVHPCYPPHVDAVDGYSIEGRYTKPKRLDWLPAHAYHRKVSTYVNLLAEVGLPIIRMEEPPDENPSSELEGRTDDVPNLLYVRCQNVIG